MKECDLHRSLGAPQTSDRSDDDWLVEIERRARAAIAGEPGVSWEEVREEVERRLADKREGSASRPKRAEFE